eukprot:EG_transcript_55955
MPTRFGFRHTIRQGKCIPGQAAAEREQGELLAVNFFVCVLFTGSHLGASDGAAAGGGQGGGEMTVATSVWTGGTSCTSKISRSKLHCDTAESSESPFQKI